MTNSCNVSPFKRIKIPQEETVILLLSTFTHTNISCHDKSVHYMFTHIIILLPSRLLLSALDSHQISYASKLAQVTGS